MHFSSNKQLREYLIELFDPVKDIFPEYKKIYDILITYKVLPTIWLESLYKKTKAFGIEQYHHYIAHVHDDVHERIKYINEQEAAQTEDAEAFLHKFLGSDE